MIPEKSFWQGKKVLVTGHSGFKGSWLGLWLHHLGAETTGVSLAPATYPNLFELIRSADLVDSRLTDIRVESEIAAIVHEIRPDIVFHLAAQPLVRAGYRHPLETFSTNIMGTAHLLEALRESPGTRAAVLVTTDKVYANQNWCFPYREDDRLGGHDPYSASKAASELVIGSYRDAFLADLGMAIATARAGNVIGGGDWSPDRLIPDAVRAWQSGKVLKIRNPLAIRPWQHVLEPLAGYLRLAERLWDKPELAGAYNFGPEPSAAATVREVIEHAHQCYGCGDVQWGVEDPGPHETGLLSLETSKARALLGIQPRWSLSTTVEKTMRWYLDQAKGADSRQLCLNQIREYEGKA